MHLLSFLLIAFLLPLLPAVAQTADWPDFSTPISGDAGPIGSYSNGCLVGGVAMPLEGPGHQVIRISRNRNWGHQSLIAFIEDLGAEVEAQGLPRMLVGDLSMPRGGPFAFGHRSHQTGLDVDIWLRLDHPLLSIAARETVSAIGMVAVDGRSVTGDFTEAQATLIELAARHPAVARIFVNPAIKLDLCERAGGDRSWLRVVRPWFGHDSHMHVRLHCPEGAADCTDQTPPPAGDGCGAELLSWFEPPDPNAPAPQPRPPRVLPAACQAIAFPDRVPPPLPPRRPS